MEETKDKSAALGAVGRLLEVEDIKSMSRLCLVFLIAWYVARGIDLVVTASVRGKLAVCWEEDGKRHFKNINLFIYVELVDGNSILEFRKIVGVLLGSPGGSKSTLEFSTFFYICDGLFENMCY